VFPATFNKREIADKQKMDETYNISGSSRDSSCPLFRKRGGQSEDPNLPIGDRRKIIPYKQ